MKTRAYGGFLLVFLLNVCAVQAIERGTLEAGLDVGVTRFSEFASATIPGYDYTAAQLRAGLFVENSLSLETHVRLDLVSEMPEGSDAHLGLDLAVLYHFSLDHGEQSFYFGPLVSVERTKITASDSPQQFGFGGTFGLKTTRYWANPRIDFFVQRRFANNAVDGYDVIGFRFGVSKFFKSSSPWDK